MKVRWGVVILSSLITLLIGSGLGYVIASVLDAAQPVVKINTVFDANSITYRDGRIQLYFSVKYLRQCPSETTRWFTTMVNYRGKSTELKMPLGITWGQPGDVGDQTFLLSLEVPYGVWDGTWYYEDRTVYQCGGGLDWFLPAQIQDIGPIPVPVQGTGGTPPKGFTVVKGPPPPEKKPHPTIIYRPAPRGSTSPHSSLNGNMFQ